MQALAEVGSFAFGRGTAVRSQISKLKRLLPTMGAPLVANATADESTKSVWKLGLTKCDRDFQKQPKSLYKDAVNFLTELEPSLETQIVNTNSEMFRGRESSRTELIQNLKADTRTSAVFSDCLDPNDTDLFA